MVNYLHINLPYRYLLWGIAVTCFFNSCDSKNFNSEEWQTWVEQEHNLHDRYLMSEDLIKSDLLVGLDSSKVIRILGVPDQQKFNGLLYDIGPCMKQLLGISYSMLDVTLKNEEVEDVKIVCH